MAAVVGSAWGPEQDPFDAALEVEALSVADMGREGILDIEATLAKRGMVKQTVDEWLNQVNYQELNLGSYRPSEFALNFMNFIKLVNGESGEENKTPVVHLAMLDQITGKKQNIANLCARGMAKTTLFFEYLVLYLAVFGHIDGFGKVEGMIYVSDSIDNGVKSARKNIEFRWENSEFLQEWLPRENVKFTDTYLEFKSKEGNRLGVKMFGAKTGLRGTKIFGKRPTLCVLDDLVSDDDAKSKTNMQAIRDTISKGVDYALHPTKRKTIFNGTPFNKGDVLYEAVESGAWYVNVWPICEKFPCSREEFNGAWEDRFTYDAVMSLYEKAVLEGKTAAFYQELMLRISSSEERLVQDEEIRWYSRQALLRNRHKFNFYITTDFATKAKQSNDFSVISVWAYNANGDWFWVDGICKKQTMDKTVNDLFRLNQLYKPQNVGIEIAGQQGAFINWLTNEMITRNQWFTFAQGKNGQPGIQPENNMDKLARFNLVVPLFKAGKIYLPAEMKASIIIAELLQELQLATLDGLKSKHDDFIDTVSMLMYLHPWKPTEDAPQTQGQDDIWEQDALDDPDVSAISSYIV